MQRRGTFGGGVSPRGALLRGQSIIEYVLIIAIIGLVIVFAGPGVAGAIRNQFNLVGNTVNSGTTGGVEGGGASAKVKAAMDAGTRFTMNLTNGKTLEYRIIGINHDDLADASAKAGLTFLTTSTGIKSRMNATDTNAGGWEKSDLRRKMNSGEIWNLMPSEFQSKVKSVRKLTNNVGGGDENKNAAVTATTDKLFLLSYSEIVSTPRSDWSEWPWIGQKGTQYEAFKGKVTNNDSSNSAMAIGGFWWERSVGPGISSAFLYVGSYGAPSIKGNAANSFCVCPAWCF